MRGPILGKDKRLFMPKATTSGSKKESFGIAENHGKTIMAGEPESLAAMMARESSATSREMHTHNQQSQGSSPTKIKMTDASRLFMGGASPTLPKEDKHNLKMKIKTTRLYRKQIMKPLIRMILSLQLLIEQDLVPKLQEEVKWNNEFFSFSWDEYSHAKQEIKRMRQ